MLRLHSVVSSGFGKETGLISFLYSHLLNIYGLSLYDLIIVNHIGLDLEEKIFYDKGKIHINIRCPLEDTFLHKSASEKNLIFLDIIHSALLRLSNEDARIVAGKVETGSKQVVIEPKNITYSSETLEVR